MKQDVYSPNTAAGLELRVGKVDHLKFSKVYLSMQNEVSDDQIHTHFKFQCGFFGRVEF